MRYCDKCKKPIDNYTPIFLGVDDHCGYITCSECSNTIYRDILEKLSLREEMK